jgi:hypothetical protein
MSSRRKKFPKKLKTVESLSPEMRAVEKLLKLLKKGKKPDIHSLIAASDLATRKWQEREAKSRERFRIAFSKAYHIYLLGEAKDRYQQRIMEDVKAHRVPIQKNSHFSMLVCKRYLGSDNSAASAQGQAMRGACLMGWDAETLLRNLKEGEWSMRKLVKRFHQTCAGHPPPGDPDYLRGGLADPAAGEENEAADDEADASPTFVWPSKYLGRWTRFANGQDISITVRKIGAFRAEVVTTRAYKRER